MKQRLADEVKWGSKVKAWHVILLVIVLFLFCFAAGAIYNIINPDKKPQAPNIQNAIEIIQNKDLAPSSRSQTLVNALTDLMNAKGKTDISEAVEPVCALLQDPDVEVQKYAAATLKTFKDNRSVGPLIARIQIPPPEYPRYGTSKDNEKWSSAIGVYIECFNVLGAIGDSQAVGPILAAANSFGTIDLENTARETAKKIIINFGPSGVDAILNSGYTPMGEECLAAIEKAKPGSVYALTSLLEQKDYQGIINNLYFFILLKSPGSEPVMIEALNACGDKDDCWYFINEGNEQLQEVEPTIFCKFP
jgi:hypothetical protein